MFKERNVKKGTIDKVTSYVMAVPRNQEDIENVEQVIERLKRSSDFEVLDVKSLKNPIVFFIHKGEAYSAEIFLESAEIPAMYSVNQKFIEAEFEQLKKAEKGITVGLIFGASAIESFHMQIKLLNVLVPEIIGIVDFSSWKVITGKWAMLAAKSQVPPSPDYIYSIHCVSGEDGSVWLHTHGLNRCGVIDFEILNSREHNYRIHADVLKTLSNITISNGEMEDEGEPKYIINLGDEAFVATWLDWQYVLKKEPKLTNGGKEDHMDAHNENTGVIYTYLSEADYKKKKYTHVSVYDELLSDNPLMMYTIEETNRMKALAVERFDVFSAQYNKNQNKGIIKFGIIADEEYQDKERSEPQKEHIWFDVQEINGDKIRAVLTQKPYYLKAYKEGETYILDKSQITDWHIYTAEDTITPDRIYMLQD